MDTKIKICGITCVEDALAALDAGVDMLGLNFSPQSPRQVTSERAADIAAAVGGRAIMVGLFVDQTAAQVAAVLAAVPLDLLQFHGSEPDSFCRQFGKPYMKVFRLREKFDADAAAADYPGAWALLLDAYVEGVPGGTGSRIDAQFWPAHSPLPLLLAGGLDVDNVGSAVKLLRPYAVDVSSGVETERKGVKDHQKMKDFVRAVKQANEDY